MSANSAGSLRHDQGSDGCIGIEAPFAQALAEDRGPLVQVIELRRG